MVAGTKEVLSIVAKPKDSAAYGEALKRIGQTVVIEGVMTPGKDLKVAAPLQIDGVR